MRALGNLSRVVRFSSQSFAYDRQADSMVVSSRGKPTKGLSISEDLGESRSSCNAYLESSKWLEKMVQAFISCVTTGNVKVFLPYNIVIRGKSKGKKGTVDIKP